MIRLRLRLRLRLRRAVSLGVVGVVTVGLLAGCTGTDQAKLVRGAVALTRTLSSRYTYTDTTAAHATVVRGLVEDDFRYKARVTLDGSDVLDEVASDDAIADRFLDPTQLTSYARRASDGTLQAPPADAATKGPAGISVIEALQTKRWVLDSTGAPALFGDTSRHTQGDDPVYDARTIFDFVLSAMNESAGVTQYDSESLSPVYKPDEDPFPKPKHGAPVTRYDLVPPRLPSKQDRTSGANETVPETRHFRKMAIYIQGGRIVRVMEVIDVVHQVKQLQQNYDVKLQGTPAEQADAAIAIINGVRKGQGSDLIRVRQLDVQFTDQGTPIGVDLPTDAVAGPLSLLENRGRSSAGTAAAPSGASTPTSAPPGVPSGSGPPTSR